LGTIFQAGSFLERPAVAMVPDRTPGREKARSAEGPGTVIGPYKLLEQIGERGMGDETKKIADRKAFPSGATVGSALAKFWASWPSQSGLPAA